MLINFEVLSLHFFLPNPEWETMVLSTGGNFRGPITLKILTTFLTTPSEKPNREEWPG